MQACVGSGHFFTVGISLEDKFFLENQFRYTKTIMSLTHIFQSQNRYGFLRVYALQVLLMAAFLVTAGGKPLQKGITVY